MGASACALSSPPRSWRWRSRSSSSLLREGERFTLALDRPWRARVWSPRACAQWSCNFLPLFACVLRQSPCQHPLAAGSVCPAPSDTWHSELCPRVPDVVRGARALSQGPGCSTWCTGRPLPATVTSTTWTQVPGWHQMLGPFCDSSNLLPAANRGVKILNHFTPKFNKIL
jgi:hypothetical protein